MKSLIMPESEGWTGNILSSTLTKLSVDHC